MRRSAPAAPTDTSPPAAVAAEIAIAADRRETCRRQRGPVRHPVRPRATEFAVVAESCTADCHRVRARCRRISQRRVRMEVLDAATVHDVVHRVVDVGDVACSGLRRCYGVRRVVRDVRHVAILSSRSRLQRRLTFTASVALKIALPYASDATRCTCCAHRHPSPPAAVAAAPGLRCRRPCVNPAVVSVADVCHRVLRPVPPSPAW